MDVLGRRRSESFVQLAVKLFVRTVVVSAVDVGDPEVHVVHDARQVVGGRAVLTQERRPAEAVAAKLLGRFAVPLLPLALAHGALVPADAEPLEVAQDRLFPAREVPSRVGVVDSEEHVIALAPVDHRAEGIADVQRAGRARREADALHAANVTAARLLEQGGRGSGPSRRRFRRGHRRHGRGHAGSDEQAPGSRSSWRS